MVILGLILGVLFAVVVASQGCGENHPRRKATRTEARAPVAGLAQHEPGALSPPV
jgi:hypothetical protein